MNLRACPSGERLEWGLIFANENPNPLATSERITAISRVFSEISGVSPANLNAFRKYFRLIGKSNSTMGCSASVSIETE